MNAECVHVLHANLRRGCGGARAINSKGAACCGGPKSEKMSCTRTKKLRQLRTFNYQSEEQIVLRHCPKPQPLSRHLHTQAGADGHGLRLAAWSWNPAQLSSSYHLLSRDLKKFWNHGHRALKRRSTRRLGGKLSLVKRDERLQVSSWIRG